MKNLITPAIAAAVSLSFVAEAAAEEWNVSVWGQRRAFTEHVHFLADAVAEATNGEFTMNISYGGLSQNTENLDGISIGAFEMAQFCAGYHADKNPTITVLELPFMDVRNLEEEVAVSHAVYAHPATAADLGRWNARLLMTSPMPQYNLVGTGEPRDTVAEMAGMRVRATGGIGQLFQSIGAVPTSVTSSEAYSAMEGGTVDTVAFAQHAHLSFRTIDIATWWTENLNPGTVNCPIVVNTDAYDALSDEHRAALDNAVDASIQHYLENYAELIERWDGVLAERNVNRVTIADEELAALAVNAAPIHQAWIDEMTAQGIPGQELYDLVRSTLAEHRAANN